MQLRYFLCSWQAQLSCTVHYALNYVRLALACVCPAQAINPVVLGLVRAEQTALHRSGAVRSAEEAWRRVMPLQIHGDAAFSGLGIVLESLQLADLPGFKVGGSVHVIINNQVGAWRQRGCICVLGQASIVSQLDRPVCSSVSPNTLPVSHLRPPWYDLAPFLLQKLV
jgi:hypothetical protein